MVGLGLISSFGIVATLLERRRRIVLWLINLKTETTEPSQQRPAARPNPLRQYLERAPPRYRNKRWLIGGPVAVLLLLVFGGDCLCRAARSERVPEPVAAVLEGGGSHRHAGAGHPC